MIDYVKEISDIRLYYRYTAQELSITSGLGESYISNLIQAKTRYPRTECLFAMAKALNRERKKRKQTIEELRAEIGENIIADLMEVIERRG